MKIISLSIKILKTGCALLMDRESAYSGPDRRLKRVADRKASTVYDVYTNLIHLHKRHKEHSPVVLKWS